MRGTLGVAGPPDRARERVPGRRGPSHVGCRVVRRPGQLERNGRHASDRRRQGGRLSAEPTCRRRTSGQGRERTHGHYSAGARHHGVSDRVIAGSPGSFGVCGAAPGGRRALRREAEGPGDGRSRGQAMADTLVERVTGRDAAVPTPIAVNLVLSDETLVGGSNAPATISGYGPIPAAVARGLVSGAVTDPRSRATLRRLYAHPTSGALVAMESRARLFPRGLATFIGLRDQRCRTPYCDAPIRHRDHAKPWAGSGGTSAGNGLGLCERCNHVKEVAGWCVKPNVDEIGRHTAQFITPTGAHYRSAAPPRAPTVTTSDVEVRIGIALARHAA